MRLGAAVAMCALVLVATPAWAAPPSAPKPVATAKRSLDEARERFRELEYDEALRAARQAALAPDARPADRTAAHALAGSALVIMDRTSEAMAEFDAIFAIDPTYELPAETSPRILAVFRPARARWQVEQEQKLAMTLGPDLASVKLSLAMPEHPKGGKPITVGLELTDPKQLVESFLLSYRREGERAYSTIAAVAPTGGSAEPHHIALSIPSSTTVSDIDYVLELHVAARHRSGAVVRRFGDAEHPLSTRVQKGQIISTGRWVAKQWWFWTALVAVAATAVVVPVVVTRDVGPERIVFGGAQ